MLKGRGILKKIGLSLTFSIMESFYGSHSMHGVSDEFIHMLLIGL